MRRAVVTLIITAVAVAALVSYRTHPPPRQRSRAPAAAHRGAALPAGTRVGTGVAISTPYTTVQVRAFMRHGRLVAVDEDVANDNAHTKAINSRAVPILHAEALRAGSAHIHVVSGATGTSASYISSLQSAIDQADG